MYLLTKILVKAKSFDGAKKVSTALEAESGGILVSFYKISKGLCHYCVEEKTISFLSLLRPKSFLKKRKALARSLELQRQQEQVEHVKDKGYAVLYNKLDMPYASGDEKTNVTDV